VSAERHQAVASTDTNSLPDFHREARNKHNVERLNVARVGDIAVYEVDGPFEVHENDGAERVVDVRRRRVVPLGANVY
jgi:hypothetical protein